MKKIRWVALVVAIVVTIYYGYFRQNQSARLCAVALLTLVSLSVFHVVYNSIGPKPRSYRIFVSHSWNYSNAYENLIHLLDEDPNFEFVNCSVPKESPIHNAPNSRKLYQAIKAKMEPCDVVIVMAGVYATYSTWINNEIHIAKHEFDSPKPILAVTPFGQRHISDQVRQQADAVVKWNTKSIVSAIRALHNRL